MEKKTHIVVVTTVLLAFGLILATVGSAGLGHAQKNATSSASKALKSAGAAVKGKASNMTSSAGGAANKTAGGAANKTGNATSSSSSNPLAKVPIIGKLFGGK